MVNYHDGGVVAGGVIAQSCTACGDELTVRNQGAGTTHVVVDVTGYFLSPNQTALNCVVRTTSQAVAAGDSLFLPGLGSPACPAGYTLTGGGQNYRGGVSGWVWWDATPDLAAGQWFTAGRNDTGASVTVNVYGICCQVPGR
jgi:hypothetical protein